MKYAMALATHVPASVSSRRSPPRPRKESDSLARTPRLQGGAPRPSCGRACGPRAAGVLAGVALAGVFLAARAGVFFGLAAERVARAGVVGSSSSPGSHRATCFRALEDLRVPPL